MNGGSGHLVVEVQGESSFAPPKPTIASHQDAGCDQLGRTRATSCRIESPEAPEVVSGDAVEPGTSQRGGSATG
jgi:hypothetical protein